jgi:hypothetical protein
MLCDICDGHIPAKPKNIGGEPSAHPLGGIHKGKLFDHSTTVGTPQSPIRYRNEAFCIKDIQIPDPSVVIRVYLLHLSLTCMAYRNISFIWGYRYCDHVLSGIDFLFHNLYSTEPEKWGNLNFGHRLSPPGHVFGIETSYPVKIAVSIIYVILLHRIWRRTLFDFSQIYMAIGYVPTS